jgi:hypothetical protein
MILPKIEERTLCAPIIILHKQHWFESDWEINGNHKTPWYSFSDGLYRKKIENAGGETAYDKMARKNRRPEKPRIELKDKMIIFKG